MMFSLLSKQSIFLLVLLTAGWAVSAQDKSTTAPAAKTFALEPDKAGAAVSSVNLYTGDVALPLSLISLPGHNGLDVNVSINYSSANLQSMAGTWNQESPTDVLGLGWNMDMPRVVADLKQTGTREDDEYFLLMGGASNKLIRTTSGYDAIGGYYAYETKNYQFWKIRFYYDISELYGSTNYGYGPNKWVVIKEDGSTLVFGDRNSNRKTLQYTVRWENWIGNSSQTIGQSQIVNAWNLSEMVNAWNEKVTFEYDNVEQFVGSAAGQKHTEASYLKEIRDVAGRKVQFFYSDKDPQYYAELHTEQAEPDAYQENYEKKYLSRIEVLRETGSGLFSVEFGYGSLNTGTSTAKMLLTSITQKSSGGQVLPGIQFTYNSGGATHGFLQTVTYPAGGKVTYSYSTKTPSHSSREFTANAPAGYAEPKVWLGEDYAVVAWRGLGSGSGHDTGPKDVKLYVYQWVGEWKEQFLQTIGNVSLEGASYQYDYKDFQVTLQKDFFAVLSYGSGNYYHLFVRYKDETTRGSWGAYTTTIDYGSGKPTLMSGTHFITVGSFQDDGTHPSHMYVYQGNSWRDDILNQTIGDHFYTATNNFWISHNKAGFNGAPEMNFNYLTEDRKWVTKNWPYSWLLFNSNDPSYWYSSNSFAVVMADDNPEFAYRWDLTYTNFTRDSKDKNNNDLFGGLNDQLGVYMINNSLVGVNGRLARWDGKYWNTETITSTHNSPFGMYFSYGDDYAIRPSSYVSSTINYRGSRKVFNPNTLGWEADVVHDGADRGQDFANAGIDYYYFGNGYYYRSPNGTWTKKVTYNVSGSQFTTGGSPRYEVLYDIYPFPIREIRMFKNGEIGSAITDISWMNLLYNTVKFKCNGVGNQTIVSYSSAYSAPENATWLRLSRVVDNSISGYQTDYPVTLLTEYDGTTNRYTSIDYNTSTAVMDVQGASALYNEVTVIPGSSNTVSRPYGYTKTFFYNTLTGYDLSPSYITADLQWSGTPYLSEVYDNNNTLINSTKTTFTTYARNILNGDGTKVQTGYYARPSQTNTLADGVETVTVQSYDNNTGLLNQVITYDYDSKNTYEMTRYKYFWEAYDVNRDKNILSPVIQTKKSVISGATEIVTNVSAVTWKNWNNVFAPHKTYGWKRNGTSDFDFSSWSDTNEPGADWMKLTQVDAIDAVGNVIQVTNK
jgi:hypothetical protein